MQKIFEDRYDAARQLALLLQKYTDNPNAIILAVPRGGLELGYVLAKELHLPLDVIFTKKIGFPGNPEYAIGAASLSHVILNKDFENVPELKDYIDEQVHEIHTLLHERSVLYRDNKPPLNLANKIAIVVDDGVATGSTLMATLALIKQDKPQKIILALPVAPKDTFAKLQAQVDEIICVQVPEVFYSVGQFYKNFDQVDDLEAMRLLREANE